MNAPQPNKDLGQHWLRDQDSLQAVLDIAEITNDDTVVEIGPGLGTLTQLLVNQADRVIAVEFDDELAAQLSAKIQSDSLTVVNEDIRTFNFSKLTFPYKVVGNIPYYLTSHLIRILLEADNSPVAIGLLVQKEVAERVAAEPGELSVLGVTSQLLAEVNTGPVIPAELFEPPPRVDSQVLGLKPRKNSSDQSQVIRVVKFGFSQRRKQLKNTLAAAFQVEKDDIADLLGELGINTKIRPQSLTIKQWQQLTAALAERKYV